MFKTSLILHEFVDTSFIFQCICPLSSYFGEIEPLSLFAVHSVLNYHSGRPRIYFVDISFEIRFFSGLVL